MASLSDGIPVLPHMPDFSVQNGPFSSAGDMKFHLQTLLDNKEKQLQQAGTLGQRVLAQQMELEERIRQLQEIEAEKSEDDDIDEQARERYRELADTLISWDTENAQLSSAFGSSKRFANGKTPSPAVAFAELPREEPERSKASAGTSAAQSRRAKNAAHRADDVEFAFEIGSGLLTEVRRLQSLLGERDKAIQDMKEEKDDLEKSVESLRTALRQQEQSADKYKEENWNLEVTLQELRTQLSDSQSSAQRLETEHKRLTKQLAASRDSGDQHKNEAERLQSTIEEMKAKHETDIAQARKHAAGLARDKSDLQQAVDTMKNEVARAGRRFPRFGSPLTPNGGGGTDFLTPAGMDAGDGDVFTGGASTNRRKLDTSGMFGGLDGELGSDYADSPEVSPVRPPFLAPNHPSNEIEALQQRLAHAQRQINTLKGTLQREKQLKMEYRSRLEASPGGLPIEAEEEEVMDDEAEDTTLEGKRPGKGRTITPFKVGGRGRGRGRGRGGRGGISLIERLGMAAHSPASEYNDDDRPHLDDSPPPPVPSIPIRFSQPEEDEEDLFSSRSTQREQWQDEEDEPQIPRSPSPLEPPSNRTSVDGMDPAFANVLRRVPSNGSYAGSPLRQAVLSSSTRGRTVGRRSRGGVPYKEARPASLVEAPDVLSAELLGMEGSPMKSQEILEEIEEATYRVETAEFGCQTEVVEEEKVEPTPAPPPPPVNISPATIDMGVQSDPEPVPEPEPVIVLPPAPIMADSSMQTEEEPVVVVEKSDMSIQYVYEEPAPPPAPVLVHSEMGVATDPEPQPEPVFVPVKVQAETQTPHAEKADADTQTLQGKPELRALGIGSGSPEVGGRRTTITQYDLAYANSSGDTTITGAMGRNFLAEQTDDEDEDDGAETETGVETETDIDDYHDARQSIMMSTPSVSESREDFHSVMTMTDNDFSESDDEESIKASRVSSTHHRNASESSSISGHSGRPSSYYPAVEPPKLEYEEVGVSAEFVPEPERIIVTIPPPPKPEVKEISIQTDEWSPPPPPAPVVAPAPVPTPIPIPAPAPGLYRVGSSNQQFQFIPPPTPPATATVLPSGSSSTIPTGPIPLAVPIPAPGPLANLFRESNGLSRSRTVASDRRQSIESVVSSVADDIPSRSRVASTGTMLTVVDKTKPPMMSLPPPPRLPPPPTSMPPPSFIPERRIPTSSTGSYDMPPPRPSSPPPADLIQRATTPTFGSVLSVPGKGGYFRQAGSSMPPSQSGLRQPPSTSSFRSAANAATYAQHSMPPGAALSSFSVRERERREFSTTSLTSERSMASPRSSMSSDHNPYRSPALPEPVTPNKTADITPRGPVGNSTDPAIIHAITQTMIGEFLYKYTRRAIGKGHGERRHKRFFWVHPYTKTLYWSSADPGSSNVSESSAKSAYIDGVRSVLDPNPMPPGLYQYSVVISTPQREMKITAPTKERHDIWLNALKYLLSRPNGMSVTSPGNATVVPQSPSEQIFSEDDRRPPLAASPQSQRSSRSARISEPWNTTPRGQRSRSQISVGGSIGKRSGTPAVEYLRWNGPESPYSPSKSFVDVQHHDEDDLDFELHGDGMSDDGYEGLENVRACCDGRHTVGHSGKHHHHHHHHHNHPDHQHNGDQPRHLEPGLAEHVRPVSPAWSFRSKTGSTHSHDGGGTGIFSWGRGDDGKLRFGSRRSAKTIPTDQ